MSHVYLQKRMKTPQSLVCNDYVSGSVSVASPVNLTREGLLSKYASSARVSILCTPGSVVVLDASASRIVGGALFPL